MTVYSEGDQTMKKLLIFFILLLTFRCFGADRYYLTGNWGDTSSWSAISGGAGGETVPTVGDNVFLDANSSGSLTITSWVYFDNLDCTGYTNTLTLNNGQRINLYGDTCLFVAGMTFTLGGTGIIKFQSDASTCALTTAGHTMPDIYIARVSGGVQFQDTITCADVTLESGTLDTNDQTCTWDSFDSNNSNTRTLDLGASAVEITDSSSTVWDITTATNLTLTAGTSSIAFSGSSASVAFGSGLSYYDVAFTGGGNMSHSLSPNAFNDFTITGTAVKTDTYSHGSSAKLIVNGTLSINGNSATNRLLVQSNTLGTARSIDGDSPSSISIDNVDFRDIAFDVSTDLSAGSVGDCGGNSNITFTTSADQHWTSANGGNYSTSGNWTSRVPLPQDDVYFDNAFNASQTVTADMPRLGKSIDWTGATGSPTFALTSTENTFYGSLTLISGMTLTSSQNLNFEGRSSYSITSAGKSFGSTLGVYAYGGTYSLQDAFINTGFMIVNTGTLDLNDFNCTVQKMQVDGSGTLTMGSGTLACTRTSGVVFQNVGGTVNGETSTLNISNTGAGTKTLTGGNSTFGSITLAGGTGTFEIDDSNTFNVFTITPPATVEFENGETTTVSAFVSNGTSDDGITLRSDSAGSAFTLSDTSGTNKVYYTSIKDSTAQGGARWLAYTTNGNTNVSGNTGWVFSPSPQLIIINND